MDNGEPYLDFVTELNRGGFTSDSKTVYFAKTSTIRFINGTRTGSVHLNIKYSKTKPAGKIIKPLSKYLKYNIVSGGFDSGIVYGNPYPVLGRNYYLFEQDTKFVVPYTGKYKFTKVSTDDILGGREIDVYVTKPKWKAYSIDGSGYVSLTKGNVIKIDASDGFVDFILVNADMGTKTLECGNNVSLKTGVAGKATWKVSNSRAKIVKTSSKSAQIKGVKEGKVKVTAKVDKTSYVWTITVKKSEKQINEELHANISTKCYPFKYNPGSMLLWIENDGDSVSLTGTIGLYKDGVEVETIPFSRALIGGQYITVVESNAGVEFDEVKFKEFTVKKSSKSFNDVEPDYGKMTYNKTDGYAIYTVPAVSGANSTFEGYALWISDSGEMLFYDALSVTGTEIKIPIEVVDQLEEEDPTYYCFCYK